MKKTIKIILWLLLILLIAAVGIFAAGWFSSCRRPAEPENLSCTVTPQNPVVGSDVLAVCSFTLPLCRNVEEAVVKPAPGSVLAGKPEIRWSKLRFASRTWQIRIKLRPYRPGEIPAGEIRFRIGKSEKFTVSELPGFHTAEAPAAQKLELAPEQTVKKRNYYSLYWLLLLLIPAGILLARHLRKKEKIRELTEWEKAVQELAGLKLDFHSGRLSPDRAFVDLVELMRRYLEKRFSLPVTRSTAQEFLLILDRHGDKLPEHSRPFLREFIREADMVKFARAIPEHALVMRSAASAENFIQHTRPESEVKNV